MTDREGRPYLVIRRRVKRTFVKRGGEEITVPVVRAQLISFARGNRPAGLSGRQWVKLRKERRRNAKGLRV